MKTIRTFLTLASAMTLASCSLDEYIADVAGDEMTTITVGMPETGRTSRVDYNESLEDNQLLMSLSWNKDDQIYVAGYNGEAYLGAHVFNYNGKDQAKQGVFVGKAFSDATHYKVYYKNGGLTLDEQGVPSFNYQGQTQTATQAKPTEHLKNYLYLSTTDNISAEAFNQTFMLNMQNALLCYDIQNVKEDLGALTHITLTTDIGEENAKSIELATSGEFTYPHLFYQSFDPAVLNQTVGKQLAVALQGDKLYYLSTVVNSERNYVPNTRYSVKINTEAGEGVLSNWGDLASIFTPELVLTEAQKEISAGAASNLSFEVKVIRPKEGTPTAVTEDSWIKEVKVSVLDGENATVSYSVDANELAEMREGKITVAYEGAESVTYTVKQAGKFFSPVLSLTETTKNVTAQAANGLAFELTVENPVEGIQPTTTTSVSWIKDVQATALEGGKYMVTYSVELNDKTEAREGTIIVSYTGAESVTYTVKQAGKVLPPALSLKETTKNVTDQAANGLTFEVAVAHPVKDVQPAASTTAPWIKGVKAAALVDGKFIVTYSVDANEKTEAREGTITVSYEGAKNVTYTVKQAAKVLPPALSLTETMKEVPAEPASNLSFGFTVSHAVADVQPSAATTASWIKNVTVATYSNGRGTVNFAVDANPATAAREANITVNYQGAKSVNYTVRQEGKTNLESATFNNTGVLVGMPSKRYAGVTYEALVNFSRFNSNNTVIGQEEVFLLRVGDAPNVDNNLVQVCVGNLDNTGKVNATDGNLTSSTHLSANKWYHLAATLEPSGSGVKMTLYINGEKELSKEFSNFTMPEVGGNGKALGTDQYHGSTENFNAKRGIFIGRLVDYKWGDRPMSGMLREVRVWSVARTAAQIKGNMLSVSPSSAGLETYYKFDGSDVSGSTVTDASGKHHNGTVKAGNITTTEHSPIVL